jgi:hypothetical protein
VVKPLRSLARKVTATAMELPGGGLVRALGRRPHGTGQADSGAAAGAGDKSGLTVK